MARRVFFSFHYENDSTRAAVVRNHGVTKSGFIESGYIDAAAWEEVKRKGDEAVRRWIASQIEGTTVTVVLIGSETANREWVKHEIQLSRQRGNGILGIYIHNIRDMRTGLSDLKGQNPFVQFGYNDVSVYDWVNDDGYNNFATWVERAANTVGK